MKPKQEIKVVAKIIQELTLYLMYHGHKMYTLSFNDDDIFETFHLELPHMNHNLIEQMKQQIEHPREKSIEAYYFELLGDLENKNNLELLGIFIDTIEVIESETGVHIILKRKK